MSDEKESLEDMLVKQEYKSVKETIVKEIMKISSTPQL